jgi:hypothetical protein
MVAEHCDDVSGTVAVGVSVGLLVVGFVTVGFVTVGFVTVSFVTVRMVISVAALGVGVVVGVATRQREHDTCRERCRPDSYRMVSHILTRPRSRGL